VTSDEAQQTCQRDRVASALISTSAAAAAPELAASAQGAGGVRAARTAPAIDSFYPVVRESTVGLPDRTVYRPTDLNHSRRGLPVVIMSDGGCRPSNVLFVSTLMLVAARGFVVIAYGSPDSPSDIPTGSPHPERVIEAIDWLHSPAAHRQFHDQVDPDRVAVAGQSCGGLEALVAGADPRVDSVLSLNSGFRPTPTGGYGRDSLTKLHTPCCSSPAARATSPTTTAWTTTR
jgi:acetyl esterase/lipase